jgi:hypothetical protein
VLESALVDWWEDAVGSASMSHKDVPGARRTSRVFLRQKDTGQPVLVLSRVDPTIAGRLGSGGEFSMTFAAPDPHRYRLAALKSSYLAACCSFVLFRILRKLGPFALNCWPHAISRVERVPR